MRGVNWAGGWRGEERENEEGAGKGNSWQGRQSPPMFWPKPHNGN